LRSWKCNRLKSFVQKISLPQFGVRQYYLQKPTQWIVTLILLNVRGNQGQDLYQSSTPQVKAITPHAIKNTREYVGNNFIVPLGVLDTKFKSGQSQYPTAKPNYAFKPLERPTQGQVIALDFKLLMFEITCTLLTTE